MSNLLYFVLQGNDLYLDEVFVDFNGFPIYFSCRSNNHYYLCLCCDYSNQDFVIVESSVKEIVEMLNGIITMRSTFTSKTKHWIVVSGADASLDEIKCINAPYLETDVLPEEDAKYIIASKKVEQYLLEIETKLYSDETFSTINMGIVNADDANNSSFENPEITIPIDNYIGCFTSKSKLENMTNTPTDNSFIYERIDNLQISMASNFSLCHDQSFGLKDYQERAIAA